MLILLLYMSLKFIDLHSDFIKYPTFPTVQKIIMFSIQLPKPSW